MQDSYQELCDAFKFSKDIFFQWGLDHIIYPNEEKIKEEWDKLKEDLFNNKKVFIRGYGHNGKKTKIFFKICAIIFKNNNIKIDSSNNSKPAQILQELTQKKKNDNIINYQVSHIWGKTKNPLLFTAPWNICFTPKIIDPLTGHEAKGTFSEQFKKLFLTQNYNKYKSFIDDYNSIIKKSFNKENIERELKKIDSFASQKEFNRILVDISNELSPISSPTM